MCGPFFMVKINNRYQNIKIVLIKIQFGQDKDLQPHSHLHLQYVNADNAKINKRLK